MWVRWSDGVWRKGWRTMKKSDLKTGMRVETTGGSLYIVFKDYDTLNYGHQEIIFLSEGGFTIGGRYDEQLRRDGPDEYSIERVFACPSDSAIMDLNRKGNLIWERVKPKEMTVEEIQQALGYKIKVVESKRGEL